MSMSSFYTPGVYFCIWQNTPDFYYVNRIEDTTVTNATIQVHCLTSNNKAANMYSRIYAEPEPNSIVIRIADTPETVNLNNFESDYAHLFI